LSLEKIKENYEKILDTVKKETEKAGRPAGAVKLIAAVKYADADEINFLHRQGLCEIGENRVQTLLEHYEKLEDKENIRIHFIGSLQKNKVKYIIGKVTLIHSVDSFELAKEIDRQAKKQGLVQRILIEINSGEEESKTGVAPGEASSLCEAVSGLENVRICGFMTMGPKFDDDEAYFNNFSKTYSLALDIWREKLHNIEMPIMSMGMTDSLGPAIRAGADYVRIGRAIFGPKPVVNAVQTDNK